MSKAYGGKHSKDNGTPLYGNFRGNRTDRSICICWQGYPISLDMMRKVGRCRAVSGGPAYRE